MVNEPNLLAQGFELVPYHAHVGMKVDAIESGKVRIRIPYRNDNSNPGKALHGGVYASAITAAGALAAATQLPIGPGWERGTLDLTVSYLAAAIGEDIITEAAVLRKGKEIVYSDVTLRTPDGKSVAKGLVTYRAVENPAGAERRLTRVAPAASGDEEEVPSTAQALTSLPFFAKLGMNIALMKDGRSRLHMPFRAENASDGDAVHEGALAALLDSSGAMASWSVVGLDFRYKASTVGIHLNYHAPLRGEEAVAYGRTVHRNDEIFFNHVTIHGRGSGTVAATGTVTYRIVVP